MKKKNLINLKALIKVTISVDMKIALDSSSLSLLKDCEEASIVVIFYIPSEHEMSYKSYTKLREH
jgi:hypothetical protein